jgi:putative colanic acid biosynthesis UDP-glucose lipid carrier transferase
MKSGGYAKEHASILALIIRLQDWFLVVITGYLSFLVLEKSKRFPPYESFLPTDYILALIIVFLLSAWLLPLFYQYKTWRGESILDEVRGILTGWFVVFSLFLAIVVFAKYSHHFSRTWIFLWFSFGVLAFMISRIILRFSLYFFRKKGLNQRHIVIVGSGELGQRIAAKIKVAAWTGLQITGFFSDIPNQQANSKDIADIPDLGKINEVVAYVDKNDIDQVWIAMSLRHIDKIRNLIDELHTVTVDVRLIPDIFSLRLLNHSISQVDGIPVINMSVTPMVGANKLVKWMEDKILSFIILILISPLMIIIALVIKLTSSGPVFYKQERVSWNGKKFEMLKFRTMEVNVDEQMGGPVWGGSKHKKMTRVGSFLRKTSLDEFPQFINVLRGDMSIVGPRPERSIFVEQFKNDIPSYMQKHLVKAGITGWAQVNGWRGDTSLEKRIEFDLWYVENWSLLLDIKIIIRTLLKVFVDKNAE